MLSSITFTWVLYLPVSLLSVSAPEPPTLSLTRASSRSSCLSGKDTSKSVTSYNLVTLSVALWEGIFIMTRFEGSGDKDEFTGISAR